GYRNKMEFTIVRGADAPEIGLHQADRYDVVLDIERCHLQSDTMNTLLAELRAQARARRLSVYDQDSGAGLLRFATVREGRRTGEAMMNIVAAAPDVETLTPVAEELRARENGIENCTFLPGEVRHVLPTLMRDGVRVDVVVADPPRAGFHPKALNALAALGPARLVYVSCNPSTLARDVSDLVRQGYRLEWVEPVDMFPQTPHIEAVARLRRAS